MDVTTNQNTTVLEVARLTGSLEVVSVIEAFMASGLYTHDAVVVPLEAGETLSLLNYTRNNF